MRPELNDLIDWARQAGAILREGYGKSHQINRKGRIDFTTEMDHQSEAYLMEQIRAHFPDHTIDTEESGLLSRGGESCWYIDPLDGTTNYAHALPIFCVSLAYAEEGKVLLGVVYDPMRDECFSAGLGQGAFLNGQPIHVSDTSELIASVLTTNFPYDRFEDSRNNLAAFERFTRLTQGVRRLGAAALDMCYVAAGRLDGYWEQTIHSWDIAAGGLIASEAGGRVSKLNGEADYLKPPYHILAGNPTVYTLMLKELKAM